MEIVELGPLKVVGIEVVAPWTELWTAVPRAWETLRARAGEIHHRTSDVFVDVSVEERAGTYRQLVGAEVNSLEHIPEGMTGLEIPARRYLHFRHEGPLEAIAASFGEMYAWGTEHARTLDALKLDFGYNQQGTESGHDLYVGSA